MRGSIRPTSRSRKSIGSTYQPQRRFAGGWKSSHTYSNSNSDPRRPRSQISGSNGGRNATEGGGSGGAASSSTSSSSTNRFPRTASISTGTSSPSATSSSRNAVLPG